MREIWDRQLQAYLRQFRRGQVPFFRLLLPYVLGICLGFGLAPSPAMHKLLLGVVLVALVGMFFSQAYGVGFAWCCAVALNFYALYRVWEGHPLCQTSHFSHYPAEYLIGFIAEEPKETEQTYRFLVEIRGGVQSEHGELFSFPLKGKLWMTLRKTLPSEAEREITSHIGALSYGTALLFPATYRSTRAPENPGVFDFAKHLAGKRCWHEQYVEAQDLWVMPENWGNSLMSTAYGWRQVFVRKYARHLKDPETHSLVSTLILGYRVDLDPELLAVFANTGTIHVLSVSGMHVVMVYAMWSFLLSLLPGFRLGSQLRLWTLLAGLWVYALITGLSPSVMRATLMLSLVLIGRQATGQRASALNSISASAFILLLVDPYLLKDLGFQLSYLAVLGIVLWMPLLVSRQETPKRSSFREQIYAYAFMSISAQFATFPLATYYFNQFPVYFLLANFLVVLPANLLMYLGFALMFLPEWRILIPLHEGLAWSLDTTVKGMHLLLKYTESLPGALWRGMSFTSVDVLLLFLLLAVLSLAWVRRSSLCLLLGGIICIAIGSSFSVAYFERHKQRQLIIHKLSKGLAFTYFDQGVTYLITDDPEWQTKALQYQVLPLLKGRMGRELIGLRNIPWPSQHYDDHIIVQGSYFIFRNRSLLVYDEGMEDWLDHTPESPRLSVDLLFVRGSPRKTWDEIAANISYKQVVWERDSGQGLGYSMKDNFAYVWVLDQ